MRSATELKRIFKKGWNIPARVQNYTRQSAEFSEGETSVEWQNALRAALAAHTRRRILDVGTGPGFFACLYSQMGHHATGLDFSKRMLAVARKRARDLQVDTEFVFGDAEVPPFANSTFHAISSRHLLFNLPRPGVAVREWVRMLKRGGRLILIGNDHDVQPSEPRLKRPRRLPHHPSWQPEPGYVEAVAECPLFRHGSRTLRAIMEAVGLQNIYTIDTKSLENARRQQPHRSGVDHQSPLFILVGEKPA
jgi:SAM-dependent methyltransferase